MHWKMYWFFNIILLGVTCCSALVEVVASSESPSFPKLDVIESIFKRSFEKASYTKPLGGGRTRSAATRHKEMPQEVMSYRQHGYHPGNADTRKLQCVWKAMRTVARQLPQIVSSSNDPRTRTELFKMCERHSSTHCSLDSKASQCDPNHEYRSIDGTCNNIENYRWGSAVQPFERFLPSDYGEAEGDSFSGPFDTIWMDDQCEHIKYVHDVSSLSDCKLRCSQKENCNAFNYNEVKEGCHQWECPVPIPAPLSSNKYEGYAYNLSSDTWSGPFDNVWNDDQCGYIGSCGGEFRFSLSACQDLCLRKPNCNAVNWNPKITLCEPLICPFPVPAPNWKNGYYGYESTSGSPGLRRSKKDEELPNPRKISRALSNSEPREQPKVSLMLMQWGQFLDHDITMTPEREHEEKVNGSKAIMCCDKGILQNSESLGDDCVPIDVTEDPYYQRDGRQCIRFIRSMPASRGCGFTPMEQINRITAFVDGSMIYGSDFNGTESLRTKSQGLLNTTIHKENKQEMPPRGTNQTGNDVHECPQAESMEICFLAGDDRVDEIPSLTAMHTIFIRLHNIIARRLAGLNPHWKQNDERLYQETRRIVIALIQQITYRDWLPQVIGQTLMDEHDLDTKSRGYSDTYDPKINPTIRNVFATAAFRFGHSLIAEVIKAATPANNLDVRGHFFDISVIQSDDTSPSSLLKGLTRCPAQPIDPIVEEPFTDSLFAPEPADDGNFYGLDLVSLNIQRGRDHGIPSHRKWREFCGLEDVADFEDLENVMPQELVDIFEDIYEDIDDIDLFPAGLAEKNTGDGILGPTFSCIIAHQFANIKHGDRFWYERKGQPKPFFKKKGQLKSIRSQSLASILCQFSKHTTYGFQPNAFLVEDDNGNKVKDCSSYKFINLGPWKE